MKRRTLLSFLFILQVAFVFSGYAQVGIGTTTPAATLDVTSTNDGLLIPRVALTSTISALPLTAPNDSELVYNTATVGGGNGVSPGYYYWNTATTRWIRLLTTQNNDWSLTGNAGTVAATNFIGTTDNIAFRFRTNNTERFEIPSNTAALRSFSAGSEGTPTYSWTPDTDTGIFRPDFNELGFSTGGNERFRIPDQNQVYAMDRGDENEPFYSFEEDDDTGIFSSGSNALSFSTGGNERVRIPNANQIQAMGLGSNGTPFYSFQADQNTGIYSPGADQLSFSTNGNERIRIPNTNQIYAMNLGSNAAPFYSFNADTDTGIYSSGANTLSISTGGTERLRITNGNQLQAMSGGTNAAPFYTFNGDPDTGLYNSGANTLSFATAGVQRANFDANGNFVFNNALMPNNLAGTASSVLLSAGANTPPTWSPFVMGNTAATSQIAKFYASLSWAGNWTDGTLQTFTVTDPDCVTGSSISVSITGPWNVIYDSIQFVSVVTENGQFRVTFINNTGGDLIGSIPISFIAFY